MATAIAIVPTTVSPGYRFSMRNPTLKSSDVKSPANPFMIGRSSWVSVTTLASPAEHHADIGTSDGRVGSARHRLSLERPALVEWRGHVSEPPADERPTGAATQLELSARAEVHYHTRLAQRLVAGIAALRSGQPVVECDMRWGRVVLAPETHASDADSHSRIHARARRGLQGVRDA